MDPHIQTLTAASESWFPNDSELWGWKQNQHDSTLTFYQDPREGKSVQNTLWKASCRKSPSKGKCVHHTPHPVNQPWFHKRSSSAIPAPRSSSGEERTNSTDTTTGHNVSTPWLQIFRKVLSSLNQQLPKTYTDSRWLSITIPNDWQSHTLYSFAQIWSSWKEAKAQQIQERWRVQSSKWSDILSWMIPTLPVWCTLRLRQLFPASSQANGSIQH